MFAAFFLGWQQDLKLALLPPLLCAIFRLVFIEVYGTKKTPLGEWRKWFECFRYGFWWGMLYNSYIYLLPLVLVSIPAAFIPAYFALGDSLRLWFGVAYALLLYTAFLGRMIFYYHFHDIYNNTLFLGQKADKRNFLDIFFHQNHGVWLLLSYVPYTLICYVGLKWLLGLPSLTWPVLTLPDPVQWGVQGVVFVLTIVLYYYVRYAGTLDHRNEPEWDEIPPIVKQDVFMAKATWDDLPRLAFLRALPPKALLQHRDEDALPRMAQVAPLAAWQRAGNPLAAFRRHAGGPKIALPSHIFYILGESYYQAPLDEPFRSLGIMEKGRAFWSDAHTFSVPTALSGGLISQPSLVSLLTGFYDANLEFNETEIFWQPWQKGEFAVSLPNQLQKLGYRSVFWYGGPLNWGSLLHFLPALGFAQAVDGFELCPQAPRTWLGVYDGDFLTAAAQRIPHMDDGHPVLHMLYTTSIHGPYTIPVEHYGYVPDQVMPAVPEQARRDKKLQRQLGCYWYSDQAIMDFIAAMQARYPDALFIVTGDHATLNIPYKLGLVPRQAPTLRELHSTCLAIHHRDLQREWFAGNTIGGHMNIFPTLMELIAPTGHEYISLAQPFTENIDHVVTPQHWLTREEIGVYKDRVAQANQVTYEALPLRQDYVRFVDERQGWLEVSGYLARHPELLLQ